MSSWSTEQNEDEKGVFIHPHTNVRKLQSLTK